MGKKKVLLIVESRWTKARRIAELIRDIEEMIDSEILLSDERNPSNHHGCLTKRAGELCSDLSFKLCDAEVKPNLYDEIRLLSVQCDADKYEWGVDFVIKLLADAREKIINILVRPL